VETAVSLGAHAIGIVLEPGSPRCVGLPDVMRLLEAVPTYVSRVAVMGPFAPGPHLASFDAVQAVGVRRSALEPSQRAVGVFRLGGDEPMPDQGECDAVLIDAYSREAFGGTGTRIPFDQARAAMAEMVRPVIVAGGLTPEDVAETIKELRPFAVDVSSGVEREPGVKDSGKVRAFLEAVREADGTLGP
jgi:phosphoribosylanthranilate isomerase